MTARLHRPSSRTLWSLLAAGVSLGAGCSLDVSGRLSSGDAGTSGHRTDAAPGNGDSGDVLFDAGSLAPNGGDGDVVPVDDGGGPLTEDAAVDAPSTPDARADAAVDAAPPTCTDPGGELYDGHCYFPIGDDDTWSNQEAACEGVGAHLVAIFSSGEQSEVVSIASSIFGYWIGLQPATGGPANTPSFIWVTGAPLGYTDWQSGEPSSSATCVKTTSDGWYVADCGDLADGICERD